MSSSPRSNGLWAVSQQLVTVGLSGIFGIAVIRALPVEAFGVFSYATTLATLGASVMTGGMQALAVREFRAGGKDYRLILAAVFFIREALALAVYLLFLGYTIAFSGIDVFLPTAVACLAVFARVLDAPELLFQSELRTKTPALARIVVALLMFSVRLAAIALWPSVQVFIVLFVVEQAISAAVILVAYVRNYGPRPFRLPQRAYTRTLAQKAAPLALSGIANQVNLRADVIIIQTISGASSVAVYSAAARLSELLYVLPTAYMAATFPSLIDLRKSGRAAEYHAALMRGFAGAFYLGLAVAAVTALSAEGLVSILFGSEYAVSADVLRVHVLACPFVFMAAVLSKWIVAEGVLWVSLVRHVVGAILAITLNLLLIPTYGIIGSAWATVASYAAASYLFCFFSKSTRGVALMMTRAPFNPILKGIRHLRSRES